MVTQTKQTTFEDFINTLEPAKVRNGWIHNDMIFVECGKGYGIADNGATVFLGDIGEVELFLKHGIDKGFKPIQLEALEIVKRLEDEIVKRESVNTTNTKLRTPDTKQRNNQRVRLSGNARNNSKHFKPVKVTAKLSLHPPGQK